MTVVHYGNQYYKGLAADTKPTNATIGAELEETDTRRLFNWDGTDWVPQELHKLKHYRVIKEGSKYFVIDQHKRIAQSNTELHTAINNIVSAMTAATGVELWFDGDGFTINSPIIFPVDTSGNIKLVRITGEPYHNRATAGGLNTTINASATFPTNRYMFETPTVSNASDVLPFVDIRNVFLTNTNFATRNVGGIKLESDGQQRRSIYIENIGTQYLWRGIHLIGAAWWPRIHDITFSDASATFTGESDLILESGGHTGSTNPSPKFGYYEDILSIHAGKMNSALRIKAGGYNRFTRFTIEGIQYADAIFDLNNTDSLAGPHNSVFDELHSIDVGQVPTPDIRQGALSLQGARVFDNIFRDFRAAIYPVTVRMTGSGVQRNEIELVSFYGGIEATVNDTGAGEGNVIVLKTGAKETAGTNKITHTGGVSRIIDHRKGAENSGFTSVADGGTISHGLYTTPLWVQLTPSLANTILGVTAKSTTTFTVSVKNDGGTAGTTQSVYWRAGVYA